MDSRRFAPASLLVVLSAGFILRLFVAYVLLPGFGYLGDIRRYSRWALTLIEVGPADFYENVGFSDYPPAYLYVLWILGATARTFASITHLDPAAVIAAWMKLPAMVLDGLAGLFLYRIARHLTADSPNSMRTGLLAAAIYTFNPVVLYDSALWGQTDAAGAVVMLGALLALIRGKPEVSAMIAILAGLLKPQFGVIVMPLVAIVLLKSYLSSSARSNWSGREGPVRLLTSTIAATITFYVIVTPFGLGLFSFLERMMATANGFPYLSVNAFNPWALVGVGDRPALIVSGLSVRTRDSIRLIAGLTGVRIGSTLLALGFLAGALRLLWRSDAKSIALVGVFLCLCFFILPTRVHERYVVPAFAFASLLAAFDRRWLWAAIVLTAGSLINLHAVLTLGRNGPGILPFGELARLPGTMVTSVALQTAVFVFALWRLRPAALESTGQLTPRPVSESTPSPITDMSRS